MGNKLTREQHHFVEGFATASNFDESHLAAGLTSLEKEFAAVTAACEVHASTIELINAVADALYVNAVEAKRIDMALEYARLRIEELLTAAAASTAVSGATVTHAAAAVRFAQILVSLTLSRHDGSVDTFNRLCNATGAATRLHHAAITTVAAGNGPASASGELLRLHAEVLLLLLSYYSTALYHPALVTDHHDHLHHHQQHSAVDPHADGYFDALMYNDDVALVRLFFSNLLSVVCTYGMGRMSSVMQYRQGYQPSMFNLYNMLWLANRGQRVDLGQEVASRAVQLLALALTYKKPSHRRLGRSNVLIEMLRHRGSTSAGDGAASARRPAAAPYLPLFGGTSNSPSTFEVLASVSRRVAEIPTYAVLLYALLQTRKADVLAVLQPTPESLSQTVEEAATNGAAASSSSSAGDAVASGQLAILARASIQEATDQILRDLLTGVAELTYKCVASSGIEPMSFLLNTLLLILSVEPALVTRMFHVSTKAPWYAERYVGDISVGSLIVTVVSRTAARAVALGNHDVAELSLGVIANMAPHVHNLNMIAAQRIVTMLRHLLKRLHAAREQVARDSTDYAAASAFSSIETHCCLTIDSMLGMLDGAARANHSLIYDLLHQKNEIFAITSQFAAGTALGDAVAPLAKLVSFFEAELTSFAVNSSVEEVMRVIRKTAEAVSAPSIVVGTDRGRATRVENADDSTISACERNVFEYVEEEDAYEYFASLIWRLVLKRTGSVLLVPVLRSGSNHRLLQSDDAEGGRLH